MPIDPREVVWDAPDPGAVQWDDEPKKEPKKAPQWSDLPGNIIPSGSRFVGGLWNAVTSPVQTLSGVFDLAAGGLRNVVPDSLRSLIDKADPNPQAAARASATADAAGQFYKDRYGGAQNVKQTLIEDPVGAAADLSTVLGLGAMATPGKVSNVLQKASTLTNPLSLAKPAAKVVGKAGEQALGMFTSPEAVSTAAKAGSEVGKTGDKASAAFWSNLRGKVPMADVIDEAKTALSQMRAEKNAQYRSGMIDIKGDRTVLSLDGIDDALAQAKQSIAFKGITKDKTAAKALKEIEKVVTRYRIGPPDEFRTAEALDALKQTIGATLESIPYNQANARRVVGEVYNAAKNEITKQAPKYAEVMKGYAEAADEIAQIEKSLSLGGKINADTTLRKLQSLMRNNVNTTYGQRLKLAESLQDKGGKNLMPAIAGQSMNSWLGRGLVGRLGQMAAGGGGMYSLATGAMNPAIFAAGAAVSSPKLVGGSLYGGGLLAGGTARGLGALGMTPDRARLLGLLGERSESIPETDW